MIFLLGNLLDRSGWTHVLSNLVISFGKDDAMLAASCNVVLCRYMHEITACVHYSIIYIYIYIYIIYIYKREAHKTYKSQWKDQQDISQEE